MYASGGAVREGNFSKLLETMRLVSMATHKIKDKLEKGLKDVTAHGAEAVKMIGSLGADLENMRANRMYEASSLKR